MSTMNVVRAPTRRSRPSFDERERVARRLRGACAEDRLSVDTLSHRLEIAYTARTGPGNDVKVLELATGQVRQLSFGEGTNESPSFSPNGRHLAFMSTRSGKSQIFTMARDGKDLRQVTRTGNNYQPDWSK